MRKMTTTALILGSCLLAASPVYAGGAGAGAASAAGAHRPGDSSVTATEVRGGGGSRGHNGQSMRGNGKCPTPPGTC
jgi:hypothetical protein